MSENETYHHVAKIIRTRRTCKNFDGSPVTRETIANLLDLAIWAPNHRLNEPWRFRVLSKSGVLKLIDKIRHASTSEEAQNFEKSFEKLKTAGAIIYVTCLRDDQPQIDLENFAATSAAVQNILLSATAMGIQSYWGTGKLASHSGSSSHLNLTDSERFVGWIWLGKGEVSEPKPRTPSTAKTIYYD